MSPDVAGVVAVLISKMHRPAFMSGPPRGPLRDDKSRREHAAI